MFLFLTSLAVLIISLYIVYSLIPFIKNKEKLIPRRGLLIAGFVGAPIELVLIVLMILLALFDKANTAIGIWVLLPVGLASTAATSLYLWPYLKCDFYMPEIKRD